MTLLPSDLAAPPSFRLDGKRALVVGAGRGIGLAAATALCDAGAHVTLVAREPDPIEDAALALCHRGGRAQMLQLDVRDADAVNAALAAHPPFDVLVNNAAADRPAPFIEVTATDFDAVMAIDLRATFFVAQSVTRGMIAAGRGGTIINLTLNPTLQPASVGSTSLLAASKQAIEGLTKALAIELAPHRIRVNVLASTPALALAPAFIDVSADATAANAPSSRIAPGRSADLAGAVVFLASDASALMTGASLVVGGSLTAA